jgi:hypothetical protein
MTYGQSMTHDRIEGISHGIGEVEGNTQSIDRRLMSPEERFKDIQRRLPANAK